MPMSSGIGQSHSLSYCTVMPALLRRMLYISELSLKVLSDIQVADCFCIDNRSGSKKTALLTLHDLFG